MSLRSRWVVSVLLCCVLPGTGLAMVHLESPDVILLHNVQMLLTSVMLAIFLWVLTDFLVRRDPFVGWFAVTQFVQVLLNVALLGHLPCAPPGSALFAWMVDLAFPASLMATLLFNRYLVTPFQPSRYAMWMLFGLIALCVVQVVAVTLGLRQPALWLGLAILVMLVPTLLWIGYSASKDVLPGRLSLRIAHNTLSLLLLVVVLIILDRPDNLWLYRDGTVLQGAFSATVIGLFLFWRSYALGEKSIQNRLRLELVEQRLYDHKLKIEEQSRFMDMLSHELKTPLSVMQITLDTLELPVTKRARLERAVNTMLDIIDRCRLSSQIEENRVHLSPELFDFEELIEEVVDSCLTPSRVVVQAQGVLLETDRQLLSVILHNLVDNALKYSPPGSEIEVSLSTPQGLDLESFDSQATDIECQGVTLSVRNRYVGSQAPDCSILFEKYARDAASSGLSGSGLGLYLSAQLTHILGGRLTCEIEGPDIVFALCVPRQPHDIEHRMKPIDGPGQ